MCGGCNIYAEGAGASLVFARYWWVARQGRRAVTEAERIVADAPVPVDREDARRRDFVDPMPEVTRVV